MRDKLYYAAIIEHDADGYAISFPDVPGCFTCTDTEQKVIDTATDALTGHLQALLDAGEALPTPTPLMTLLESCGRNTFAQLIGVHVQALPQAEYA
jgi:predicted RNase H-like HicB family nuclease